MFPLAAAAGAPAQLEVTAVALPEEVVEVKPRVLFVDDELINCKLGSRMLSALGYVVTVCHDGDEVLPALQRAEAEQQPYSAAFIDVGMKRVHGDAAVSQLRSQGAIQSTTLRRYVWLAFTVL